MRSVRNLPRPIVAELVEVGDLIVVTHPSDGGITTSYRGRVASIESHAGMNHYLTAEGAVLARVRAGQRVPVSMMLLERAPVSNEPLSLFDELETRAS